METLRIASLGLLAVANGAQLRGQYELATSTEIKAHEAFAVAVKPAIDTMLGQGNANIGQAVKEGAAALDINSAITAVKPPADIVKLLAAAKDKKAPKLDKDAVAKAVTKLNDMVESAQVRLDAKSIECMEFKEKNRDTAEQVTTDLARIGATLANDKRAELKTNAEIADAISATEKVEEEQLKQKLAYEAQKGTDDAQMKINQADLQVTSFMLELSRCKDASLLQVASASRSTEMQTCKSGNTINVTFNDSHLQSAKEQLTARTQQLLDFALAHTHSEDAALRMAGLAFGDGLEDLEDGNEDAVAPEDAVRRSLSLLQVEEKPEGLERRPMMDEGMMRTTAAPTVAPATEPMNKGKQGNRCAGTKPNCGVLHDTFSALWGEIKDLVEALQAKLDADNAAWKALNDDFNKQIASLTARKGELGATLAEVEGSIITESDMQGTKQEELAELDATFEKTWGECTVVMNEILFTEICGVITVRNEVVQAGYDIPKDEVVDCSFTDWLFHECSVPCDDDLVGGKQLLTREVITPKTENGHACPAMNMTKRCNQILCPVDCKLTDYEDYSKCTKECGGGVQSHSRNLVIKPKNGGESCDTLQETQLCNSFSCDRNCELTEWSPFSPCTQACDGGYQEHFKTVTIPVRGEGTCPADEDPLRHERRECNAQACIGDEECIARLDVVLVLDGSGSLTEDGFKIMQTFAVTILDKLRPKAFEKDAVQVAVVQFGNGKLEDNGEGLGGVGTVSDAILGQGFSGDMEATRETITALTWQRGFTNMAQGIAKAGILLKTSMRKDASGVAIVLTDGRPSFKLSTEAAVKKLRETSTLMIVQIKSFPKEENIKLMKEYVSEPADVNYMYIPGKKQLKGEYTKFATELLVKSCPRAISPSAQMRDEMTKGFKVSREGEVCDDEASAMAKAESPEMCFAEAQNQKSFDSFAFASWGECRIYASECTGYTENFDFNIYTPSF